jgi:hypothetical protein
MTAVDFELLTVTVPLWEEPPGVFRVGKSRVLLELVLRAFQRGETPEGIVRSYRTLELPAVYAVISRYLADPALFDAYLRRCDEEAEAVRRHLEVAGMTGRVSKDELLSRALTKTTASVPSRGSTEEAKPKRQKRKTKQDQEEG